MPHRLTPFRTLGLLPDAGGELASAAESLTSPTADVVKCLTELLPFLGDEAREHTSALLQNLQNEIPGRNPRLPQNLPLPS